jgi:colanic acid biosynthesis glycosyl transferase WcaI
VHCGNWLIGNRRRKIDRILENITFGLSSTWATLAEGRPDLLIIETWPLFAATFSILLARIWHVAYLYYVQDVFPEAAEQAQMINPTGTIARALRSWDRWLCKHSATTIAISEGMKELLATRRGLPNETFTVIPNWIDESEFPVWKGDYAWRRSIGISDETFVAMFAGTLGHVSGAEILVEVAQILQAETRILLLCIGEGVRKQTMIEQASRRGFKNIMFLPFQPAERVPEVQSSCQVALLTVHPNHLDTSVPSKLISYLAASRPVICSATVDSTVGQTVLDSGAGVIVPPGDAQGIASAIVRLVENPPALHRMGTRARQYFEHHFTLDRAHRQFEQLINRMGNSSIPPSPSIQERQKPQAVHED